MDMSISRLLTRIQTTGLAAFGHNSRYTQLRTSDQEDKDDGYYDSSPDGSSSVSRSSQDVGDSAFDSLSSKLEGGSPDRPVPFHRPLQSERRGIIRRLRVWIALLAMLVVLVTILCHRLTSRTVGDVDRGPSSVIINTNLTEAGTTSTSVADEDMLIDDPPGTPSPSNFTSGVFRNGILELNNLTSLDESHQAVTDMLGLTITTDTDGRDELETSTEASNLYMVVDPDQHPGQPKTYPALRPVTGLSGTQLVTWFMYGFIDNGWTKPSLPQAPELDVVMTWVNGSDPLWALERDRQAERYGLSKRVSNLARHWRDNGMGPYPIRSVVDAFSKPEGRSGLRRIHLVTADMQLDGIGFANNVTSDVESSPDRPWTMGQVPSWLDQGKLVPLLDDDVSTSSDQVELQMHFHSEAFQLPESLFGGIQTSDESQSDIRWKDADEWKRDSVPTFNSFAIEWQMGWLKGVGDLSVHMNDDMLLLAPLTTSDFYSIPFGSVLRVDDTFQLRVPAILDPTKVTDTGEWGGLQHANYLLSRRFPDRSRHYLHHLPKTLSKPIIHEAMHMFGEEIALASSRPFREVTVGDGDIEMGFMVTHLRIERWREALLWIWAVGKMGNLDSSDEIGTWGEAARAELKSLLNLETLGGTTLVVKQDRDTLNDMDSTFKKGNWETPKATTYSFSSMDGHVPPIQLYEREGPETCMFKVEQCLGEAFVNGTRDVPAEEMFKHLAFADWRCGDCLINALVNQSGKSGLSAFFPAKDVEVEHATVDSEIAHLPLTSSWRDTDFSLGAVTRGHNAPITLNLREWGMKMLSRYLYVTGGTPSHFVTLNQASQATKVLGKIDADPSMAMVCFNDDARRNQEERISNVMNEWLGRRFDGKEMYWENKEEQEAIGDPMIG